LLDAGQEVTGLASTWDGSRILQRPACAHRANTPPSRLDVDRAGSPQRPRSAGLLRGRV